VPEVRVRSLLIVLILAGGVVVAFVFFGGAIAYWAYEGWAAARGYTAAKTPQEAMDKFRDAIQKRDYKDAARYTTKSYGELLKRAHPAASELGAEMDRIRNFAKDKGFVTDKLVVAFHKLDPFPKNFKSAEAPKEKDGKAYGRYVWEDLPLKNQSALLDNEVKNLDPAMFNNILARNTVFVLPIELVKEGDEWKLNVPVTPDWETAVSVFLDRNKSYHTALHGFAIYMTNERYDTGGAFEREVLSKLAGAKQ